MRRRKSSACRRAPWTGSGATSGPGCWSDSGEAGTPARGTPMAKPSPQRVEELFDQAFDLGPARRAAFLDEQCQGDADLRAAVEKLLQLDSKAQADESLLRSPLAAPRPQALAPPAPPAPRFPAIARYRVVRLLGEGGMGTVYEAEQDNPRRTVALKVIRAGLASE